MDLREILPGSHALILLRPLSGKSKNAYSMLLPSSRRPGCAQLRTKTFISRLRSLSSDTAEVRKLVNLAAPLRVLITVAQWDEESTVWGGRGGAYRSILLPRWEQVIRQHQIVWPRVGVVGILVGEWRPDKRFRFYAYGYGEGHRLAVPSPEILLEKPVGYEDPHQALAATQV
jgi:hypothetical protein